MSKRYKLNVEMVIETENWTEQEVHNMVNENDAHLNFKVFHEGMDITEFKVKSFNKITNNMQNLPK